MNSKFKTTPFDALYVLNYAVFLCVGFKSIRYLPIQDCSLSAVGWTLDFPFCDPLQLLECDSGIFQKTRKPIFCNYSIHPLRFNAITPLFHAAAASTPLLPILRNQNRHYSPSAPLAITSITEIGICLKSFPSEIAIA
ncbi:hypothetical protein LXL04_011841 [Taraxacum kok-saghyz]